MHLVILSKRHFFDPKSLEKEFKKLRIAKEIHIYSLLFEIIYQALGLSYQGILYQSSYL